MHDLCLNVLTHAQCLCLYVLYLILLVFLYICTCPLPQSNMHVQPILTNLPSESYRKIYEKKLQIEMDFNMDSDRFQASSWGKYFVKWSWYTILSFKLKMDVLFLSSKISWSAAMSQFFLGKGKILEIALYWSRAGSRLFVWEEGGYELTLRHLAQESTTSSNIMFRVI